MWRQHLKQAQNRCAEDTGITEFVRGGPGFIAAVCVRDHWQEMDQEDQAWCRDFLIAEVEQECDSEDRMIRLSRSELDASRPAAHILPAILRTYSAVDQDARLVTAIARSLTHACREVAAYSAAGVGEYLGAQRRHFTMLCAGALALQARLVGVLDAAQESLPYQERQSPDQLMQVVVPQAVAAITAGRVVAEEELAALDLGGWPGQGVIGRILVLLRRCSDDGVVIGIHKRVAERIAKWWDAERARDNEAREERPFELEHECSACLARFSLHLQPEDAIALCEPFLDAVERHARELATFMRNLIIAEDRAEGSTTFWTTWQAFADRVKSAGWIQRLDACPSNDAELLHAVFLGIPWKEEVRHWERLEGNAKRIDILFQELPPGATVLDSYCRYLYSIGRRSLPEAFVVIAKQLRVGTVRDMLSKGNTVFCLEALLRGFVYGQPMRVKSVPRLRSSILEILDGLVEAGSSAAFRMRDDFVTPLAGRTD